MGLFGRKRSGVRRGSYSADVEHLRSWASVREGVEGFVEPQTTVTETTMLLVAKDGEWTRRRIAGPDAAKKLARSMRMPVYDVQLVGYPQRMRDHDARQKVLRRREELRRLAD
ncbi:oxidoreductase [Pseudonocardia xishanensis]|uniref:Oxidoreductase n=1 Tax=Pseudonocardia xishanensis TaxID=630995 RepID=A0ABP8RSX1_9PSEU